MTGARGVKNVWFWKRLEGMVAGGVVCCGFAFSLGGPRNARSRFRFE